MATGVYGLYHAAVLDDINLTQITNVSISPGIANRIIAAGGNIDPRFMTIGKLTPGIQIVTTELKRVLDKVALLSGFELISTGGSPTLPFNLFLQRHVAAGVRSVGSDFLKFSVTDGMVVIRAISFADGQESTVAIDIIPVKADGTNPLVVATGIASPAIAVGTGEVWTSGPVKINTPNSETSFIHMLGGTIDPGLDIERIGGDGHIYDKFAAIRSRNPSMRLRIADMGSLADLFSGTTPNLEMTGIAATAVALDLTTVYLTKMLEHSVREINATATHISFALTKGKIDPDAFNAAGPSAMTQSVIITPIDDGTAAILAIDTTATIPVAP